MWYKSGLSWKKGQIFRRKKYCQFLSLKGKSRENIAWKPVFQLQVRMSYHHPVRFISSPAPWNTNYAHQYRFLLRATTTKDEPGWPNKATPSFFGTRLCSWCPWRGSIYTRVHTLKRNGPSYHIVEECMSRQFWRLLVSKEVVCEFTGL